MHSSLVSVAGFISNQCWLINNDTSMYNCWNYSTYKILSLTEVSWLISHNQINYLVTYKHMFSSFLAGCGLPSIWHQNNFTNAWLWMIGQNAINVGVYKRIFFIRSAFKMSFATMGPRVFRPDHGNHNCLAWYIQFAQFSHRVIPSNHYWYP